MEEIFKHTGFALITSIFIMLLMLSLGLYATSFVITGMKISDSQANSVKTYYLAEAGVAQAIWKIKNDATWKNNFESDANWTMDYARNSALYSNGSYRIQIANSDLAKGDITVTASLDLGSGNIAKRVVKVGVYKALGQSVIDSIGEYSDGNMNISGSYLNVLNGGIFSNSNIQIKQSSIVHASGTVAAVRNLLTNGGTIFASSSLDMHTTPKPVSIPMPAVSFDNARDPNSYKARANNIYSASQFSNLLWANQNKTLTLNGITYVTGAVDIKGRTNLIINGILVADGDITIGHDTNNCCWGTSCGYANVTTTRPNEDGPAGILSKGDITFDACLNSFNGVGLIYADSNLNISSLPHKIYLTGAFVANSLSMSSIWQSVDLTVDNSAVVYTLGDPQFSPIVTIDHWEEEY